MHEIRSLTPELQKIACEQLFEVPERIPADLATLKAWIQQQPHLRARTDDQFLMAFLRGCKYSLEKAKSKLDKFYTMRTKFPELFNCCNADEKQLREIVRLGVMSYLPTPLNGNGPRIVIMRSGLYPAEQYDITVVGKAIHAMQEICLLEDDYANINGVVFILDLAKATPAHMFQMTPSISKKFTIYSEEAIPVRPQQNHFLYTPIGFEAVFNMIKPMLSKKQQQRLFVHGSNFERLFEYVPKQYLPKEYGGENSSFEEIAAVWDKKFEQYSDYFKENANYGTDERLRLGTPIDFDSIFGMDGSFRKLNVD